MTLQCSRCHHDVWLLADGLCRDCIIEQEDERAIRADAERAEDRAEWAAKHDL